jgi:hypothetical protein
LWLDKTANLHPISSGEGVTIQPLFNLIDLHAVDILTPEAAGERDRVMQGFLWIGRKSVEDTQTHTDAG